VRWRGDESHAAVDVKAQRRATTIVPDFALHGAKRDALLVCRVVRFHRR
jgi:hypothetical protein